MLLLGGMFGGLFKMTPLIRNIFTKNNSKLNPFHPPKLCTPIKNSLFSTSKRIDLQRNLFQKKENTLLAETAFKRYFNNSWLKNPNATTEQFSIKHSYVKYQTFQRSLSTCAPPIMDPKGRVAIITGGMRGLGLCVAEELLCLGAKVVIMDVDREVGECAVKKLHCTYGQENSFFFHGDVTCCQTFEECFNQTLCCFKRVDILVNNAGILQPQNWQNTIRINFIGVVYGIHLGLKYMGVNYGKEGGVIINVASIVGHIPLGGAPVYSATKHGILALTLGYADNFHFSKTCVRMCAVCPGVTETSMIQVKELNMDVEQRDLLACQLGSLPSQPADRLGPAVSHIVRYGQNGSIWISENSELYQVVIPHYKHLECPGTRVSKIGH